MRCEGVALESVQKLFVMIHAGVSQPDSSVRIRALLPCLLPRCPPPSTVRAVTFDEQDMTETHAEAEGLILTEAKAQGRMATLRAFLRLSSSTCEVASRSSSTFALSRVAIPSRARGRIVMARPGADTAPLRQKRATLALLQNHTAVLSNRWP